MYIGKHKGHGKTPSGDPIHIPENYAGNAFFEGKEEECDSEPKEEPVCILPACTPEKKEHGGFLPHFDKLFQQLDKLAVFPEFNNISQ